MEALWGWFVILKWWIGWKSSLRRWHLSREWNEGRVSHLGVWERMSSRGADRCKGSEAWARGQVHPGGGTEWAAERGTWGQAGGGDLVGCGEHFGFSSEWGGSHREVLLVLISALLTFNSCSVQFAHLKCTIELVSVYSEGCATTTTIHFRTSSAPQKRRLVPFSSHFRLSPSRGKHCSLSLWICLFGRVPIYGLIIGEPFVSDFFI